MTRQRRITILYEDQLAKGQVTNFGPNNLAVSCVADSVQTNIYTLREQVTAIPCKGNSKLLRKCREDIEGLTSDGRDVIAVFDDDRIRERMGLQSSTSDEEVITKIKTGCEAPGKLHVILLKSNLESVVRAAGECAERARVSVLALADALQKASLTNQSAV